MRGGLGEGGSLCGGGICNDLESSVIVYCHSAGWEKWRNLFSAYKTGVHPFTSQEKTVDSCVRVHWQ
jgi:hypothetical protein